MNGGTLAVILGHKRQQITLPPFTANATWTAPITTSSIDSASGKGAAGTPGSPGMPDINGWQEAVQTFYQRRDGTGNDVTTSVLPPVFDGSPKPDNYTTGFIETPDSTVYVGYTEIHTFGNATKPGNPGTPPTTGAGATAFGKTFPGGAGGPATTTTFSNIAITPGATYNIVVPSGGSITITYTQ